MNRIPAVIVLSLSAAFAHAAEPAVACGQGRVVVDGNANGRVDAGERGLAGVQVSDGVELTATDATGRFTLAAVPGRTWFVVKPAGYRLPARADGLPAFWRHVPDAAAPALRYGGIRNADPACPAFLLQPEKERAAPLDVLVFADPQTRTRTHVGYYARDIVEPLRTGNTTAAQLGLTLGDVADDDLSLYPDLNAVTTSLGVPWLHAAGNHDLDFDAAADADSLRTFRHHFGPDTFAWEEPEANFIVLDDVVYRPGQRPAYVGGLREEQFVFLERYLATVDPGRLLVIALHIPVFDEAGRETFRAVDRARLFALLSRFPRRLVLSGHGHVQRHVFHEAAAGPDGKPLHEYNVGAACGAFWSGVAGADGVPDATMADGTPNGHARLRVARDGTYALSWHPARVPASGDTTPAMALHAPRVLRRGAYPAWAVYANVFMGQPDTRVEYRVDGGTWKPMQRVERADPRLLAENVRDDEAPALRGFDRSPEAQVSTHLWRGTLPTDLAAGEHRVDVRAFDAWTGEQRATTRYALHDAASAERRGSAR